MRVPHAWTQCAPIIHAYLDTHKSKTRNAPTATIKGLVPHSCVCMRGRGLSMHTHVRLGLGRDEEEEAAAWAALDRSCRRPPLCTCTHSVCASLTPLSPLSPLFSFAKLSSTHTHTHITRTCYVCTRTNQPQGHPENSHRGVCVC